MPNSTVYSVLQPPIISASAAPGRFLPNPNGGIIVEATTENRSSCGSFDAAALELHFAPGLSGGTYPQHSGFASIENGALSDYLAYYDGVAPALGATTVQGAIDAIKPLLGGASLTNTAPADVTKAAAAVGVATDAARSDHKHDVATAAPSSVALPG